MFKKFNSKFQYNKSLCMLLIFVSALTAPILCGAQTSTKDTDNALVFEVIQDQFVLDHSTVKHAQLHQDESGKYDGISITLTDAAAQDFTEITKNSIGKRANMVFNNKIISTNTIQTSLGNNFLLTGMNKEDAGAFIQKLNLKKPDIVARNN